MPEGWGENFELIALGSVESDPDTRGDPMYQLAVALLELLDRELEIELQSGDQEPALAMRGTLLRAFDPPFYPDAATLSLMVGPHYISIRPTGLERVVCRREPGRRQRLRAVHVLLGDGGALHLRPLSE